MAFLEALFWFGIAALGVGPFFIFPEGKVKRVYGITLTVLGILACAYSVYRHYYSEALPQFPFWMIIWVLTWVLLGYDIYLRRIRQVPPTEKPKEPSKLIIHSANYAAWSGGGQRYDVIKFVRSIIRGDSLVFGPIENHSFVIDGENLVPHDPLVNKPKRLEVTYSFNGEQSKTVQRAEHGRLTLPEDSVVDWLGSELNKAKAELDRLRAAQPKSSQYPVPQLRGKIVATVSELQGFLGEHGQEPRDHDILGGESAEEWKRRDELEVKPWQAKFLGDYRLQFADKIEQLQDEMRARAHIDDHELEVHIRMAAVSSRNCFVSVNKIVERLCELAFKVNV